MVATSYKTMEVVWGIQLTYHVPYVAVCPLRTGKRHDIPCVNADFVPAKSKKTDEYAV